MKFTLVVVLLVGALAFGQRSDFDAISFDRADSIALKNKDASLKNLPILVHKLTADLTTDVEKFRAIYTWVCTNVENDYRAYQKTVKKRKKLLKNPKALAEWNDSFTPKVFGKLVNQRKTACTGYAFLIRELATLADINCEIINGYGRTPTLILDNKSIPNHSWNAVELSGKWYLCDPTWSAGRIVLEDEGPRFEPDYFDAYFLADPALFIKNHFPLETDRTLLSKPPTFKTFLAGPVVYKEAFKYNIIPVAPIQMQLEGVKNDQLSFTLATPNTFEDNSISLVLNNGGSDRVLQPKVTRNRNVYRLQHTFEKPGKYDVHIKVDDTIVATYVVKVKRK